MTEAISRFILPAGLYAVGCLDDIHSLAHPELTDFIDVPECPAGGMVSFADAKEAPALLVDAGVDSFGQGSRAIPFAGTNLLLDRTWDDEPTKLVIMRIENTGGRMANPCAPDCDLLAEISLVAETEVTLTGRELMIGEHLLDLARPGVFTLEGKIIDMADAANATRFGYADAETDEHGIHWWDKEADDGFYLYFGGNAREAA